MLEQSSASPTARIASLDALRGLSALVVFIGHAGALWLGGADGALWTVGFLMESARYAVVVFFCLSGFAIAMSLHDNMRRGLSIRRYAAARLIRVLPPLLVVLALVWLISAATNAYGPALGVQPFGSRQQYLMSLVPALGRFGSVLIGINSPLWSLQYEIQLYVIAGLGTWLCVTKVDTHRLAALLLLVAFLYGAHIAPPHRFHVDQRAPYFAAFALGALGYVGRRAQDAALIAAAALAAAAVVVLTVFGASPSGAALGVLLWNIKVVVVAIVATACVVALSRRNTLAALSPLGSWSYTLYIVHYPLVVLVASLADASSMRHVVWLVGAPAALLAAYLLGMAVERPQAQRAWLRNRFARAPAAPGPVL